MTKAISIYQKMQYHISSINSDRKKNIISDVRNNRSRKNN